MEEDSELLYQEFIKSFYELDQSIQSESIPATNENCNNQNLLLLEEDEDPNDPEYNVLQDLSGLNFDDLDFLNFFTDSPSTELSQVDNAGTGATSDSSGENIFTKDQLAILESQLCFHVQTVTQSWLLSLTSTVDTSLAKKFEEMLFEMEHNSFINSCRAIGYASNSIFFVNNLKPAVSLVQNSRATIEANERKCQFNVSLSSFSRKLFSTRDDLFLYKWALPTRRFVNSTEFKSYYSEGDAKLIAFYLNQLHKNRLSSSDIEFIASRVPQHSKKSIASCLKNKRRKEGRDLSDPISAYFQEKKIPPSNEYFTVDNLPKLDTLYQPPVWYRKLAGIQEPKPKDRVVEKIHSRMPLIFPKLSPLDSIPNLNSSLEKLILWKLEEPKTGQPQSLPLYRTRKYRREEDSPPSKRHKLSDGPQHQPSSSILADTITKTILMDDKDSELHSKVHTPKDPEQESNTEPSHPVDASNEIVEVKESNDDKIDSDDSESCVNEDGIPLDEFEDDEPDEEKEECTVIDDENDLLALMQASCLAVSKRARNSLESEHARRKSDIVARQRDNGLAILRSELSAESDKTQRRQELLINYFLKRAKSLLTSKDFLSFLELLTTFDTSTKSRQEIYKQIRQFLIETRKLYAKVNSDQPVSRQSVLDGIRELIEISVLFLDFIEAKNCGQAYNYLCWRKMFDFMDKVEMYLSLTYSSRIQQHNCLQRLIRSLSQLAEQSVDKSKIKAVVSKIFNGHPLLMEEFTSLLLDGPIPKYLYANSEDFDEFVIGEPNNQCENVRIPANEEDLNFGTDKCPCKLCHREDEESSSSISSHCSACSVRFISGRIYLPQMNSLTKKMQLIEYVRDEPEANVEPNESGGGGGECSKPRAKQWTIAEDRMLLEACRTMILDSNITKLTEQVFEQVAQRLAVEEFNQKRSVEELSERLHELIEMLTNTPQTTSSSSTGKN